MKNYKIGDLIYHKRTNIANIILKIYEKQFIAYGQSESVKLYNTIDGIYWSDIVYIKEYYI